MQKLSYNTRGLVETVTQPFFDGQPLTAFVGPPPDQPVTVTTYDGLGQLKTVTEPTNRTTKYSYVGGFAQGRDPLNRAVNRKTDGLGRLVEVLEYSGTGTSESPYSLSRHTVYRYTALDQVQAVETRNNTGTILRKTTIGYDLRGLKTWMSDRDMGTWQYRYDPAGNLIRQANGRISPDQNVTCFFYDSLNRLQGRTFENAASVDAAQCVDPGANNYTINYAYEHLPGTTDGLSNNAFGRLRSVWYQGSGTGATNPQIAHTYKYDYRGRVKAEGLTTAVGTTYVLKYYYNSLDRVTKTVYPTSEQVQTTYNAMGLPATLYSITLDRQYVTGATYTAGGALAALTLLNGTRTDDRYSDEPGVDQSQRLRQLTVTKNGTTLLNLAYGYDAVSNLTGLTDATPGREENLTLAYDAFNRLTAVSGATDSASYTYDQLDRLASVQEGSYTTLFGAWSAGSETNIPGQPRHAPQYIGTPSHQFGYDPAGNMTLRWLKQGGTYTAYTQKFNADNRLSQVSGNGTTTTYDLDAHTGTTLRRTQTSGSTT
ncbi:MAG TPA: hypothetical protein DEP84_14725, partial [Chloroflexi bacterium]|nr:hypothetical protein [Chloroflexota bacterium]